MEASRRQKEAVYFALTKQVVVLTGGPGTGKSTVTGTIIKLLKAKKKSFLLAAPTGRAALNWIRTKRNQGKKKVLFIGVGELEGLVGY